MRPSTEAARRENGNLNLGASNAWGPRLQNYLVPEALACLCLNVAVVDQAQFAPSGSLSRRVRPRPGMQTSDCHSCETPRCPRSPCTESCSIVLFACTPVFPHPWSARSSLVAISPKCPLDCTFTDWGQNNKPWCLIHFTVHTTFSLVFPPFVTTSDSESSPGELLGLGD
jgi:hypothetical protein